MHRFYFKIRSNSTSSFVPPNSQNSALNLLVSSRWRSSKVLQEIIRSNLFQKLRFVLANLPCEEQSTSVLSPTSRITTHPQALLVNLPCDFTGNDDHAVFVAVEKVAGTDGHSVDVERCADVYERKRADFVCKKLKYGRRGWG